MGAHSWYLDGLIGRDILTPADAAISRRCLAKWYARRRAYGESGLLDRSSRPATGPARTAEDISRTWRRRCGGRRSTGPPASPPVLSGCTASRSRRQRSIASWFGEDLTGCGIPVRRPESRCAKSSATSTRGSAT
ncbi:hypothetical protein HUT19_38965 [Streptomyces sp. NA02950]|uniref:leucine zipper domain-containing protein n=1 Tax=Streptomyces sp. NA02950 TaxID=2742137 RepID=UPI00159206CA|nr:hypothetical protein HUT19_38965 [Streptomyces sp. NA02950]